MMALCTAAKNSRLCRFRVISLGGDRGRGPVYVRSTSDRVEILCTAVKDAKCHQPTYAVQQNCSLFDHLVGNGAQLVRDGEAERLGLVEVDHQLELNRLLNRQVSRL